MPPNGEKKEEDPKDPNEGLEENEDGSVDVVVEEEPAPEGTPEKEKGKPPEEEIPEDPKRRDAAFAAMRIALKNSERRIAELEKVKGEEKPPKGEEETPEDLEDGLAKKPLSTIQKITKDEIQKALQEERQRMAVDQRGMQILEGSKARALEILPELTDRGSVQSMMMDEVCDEDPSLRDNPYGPEIAAGRALIKLKAKGMDKGGNPPKTPSRPPERPPVNSKTITLTKEEIAFCKAGKLDPKKYALRRKNLEGGIDTAEV